jgi:large subunit ribosomal protein L6
MFSRVGKSIIKLNGHKIEVCDQQNIKISHGKEVVDYKISKYLLFKSLPDGSLMFELNDDIIKSNADQRQARAIAGFHVRDLQNILSGMIVPFKTTIDIVGTGYKVLYDKNLHLLTFSLGYSHDVSVFVPKDIIVEIAQNKILFSSSSKRALGYFSSYISQRLRKFDKFKGKGLTIAGKYMQRKELKKK